MVLFNASLLALSMTGLAFARVAPVAPRAPLASGGPTSSNYIGVEIRSGYVDSDGFCEGSNVLGIGASGGENSCFDFQGGNCATVTTYSGSLVACGLTVYNGAGCTGDQVSTLGGPQGAATNLNGGISGLLSCSQ